MIALREANAVNTGGTNFISLADFNAISATNRSSDVLYIVGEFVVTDSTTDPITRSTTHYNINNVYVGNVAQTALVDNTGALVWVNSDIISSGFTNAATDTGVAINTLV